MNKTTFLLLFALPVTLCAQTSALHSGRKLPRPSERRAIELSPDEANPFAVIEAETVQEDGSVLGGDSEESRLRAAILRMPVRGVALAAGSPPSAVLGSMSVSVGEDLPPIFPNQIERVRVLEISENEILMGFLEHDGTPGKRSIKKVFDVTPRVRFVLPADVDAARGSGSNIPLQGVFPPDSDESLE